MFRLELYDLIAREREREVARQSRWNSLLRQMRREAPKAGKLAAQVPVAPSALRKAAEASR